MSIGITKQLNIDFYNTSYITLNAKQHDKSSRYILASCYDQGKPFYLDSTSHCAYVRYRKADDQGVLNSCEITTEGKVIIELTEQMLSSAGICYADLIVLNIGESASVDSETKEIIINSANILSTMTFCINVSGTAIDNANIESSYEFNALNELMEKVHADYSAVMSDCQESEENANQSEKNAKTSEKNAATSENNAAMSEKNAALSMESAESSETNAKASEENAANSEKAARLSEENANYYYVQAQHYGTLAKSYSVGETDSRDGEDTDNAKYYYSKSKEYKESIGDSADYAMSYAVGGSGTRDGEDTDNAKYYYELAKTLAGNMSVASVDEVREYIGIN